MPINVSNMIVNLGQTQGFDWGNFGVAIVGAIATLFAAFAGSWSGVYYSKRQKNIEVTEQNATNLNILLETLASNLNLFTELYKIVSDIKKDLSIPTQFASNRTYKAIIGTNWGEFDIKNIYFVIKETPEVYSQIVKYFALMKNLKEMIYEYNNKVYKDKNHDNINAILETMKNYLEKIDRQLLDCINGNIVNIRNIQNYGGDYFKASNILPYPIPDEARKIVENKKNLFQWWEYAPKTSNGGE